MNKYIFQQYAFEKNKQEDFYNLIRDIYPKNKKVQDYIYLIKKIKSKKNPSFKFILIKNFIAYKNNTPVGHISAMIDNRLNKESRPIGIIGFYECTNDNILSKLLIEKAINYLKSKECRLIRGPINLTIWHQYRFVLDQREEDTFSLEPITKNYYPEQFINAGFKIVCEYCSGIRRDFSTILPYTLENYKYLLKEGFSIRKLTKNNFKSGLFSINKMSNKIFKDSWSFVELSEAEFLYLYEKNKNKLNTQSVEIVSDPRGKDVGFCFSIKDPRIEKTFIVKSIGVLSEYRKKGVGATLIYNNHEKMAGEGMNTAIYALIKIGNNVTNMNYPGIKIIRKYIVLEKEII